MLWWFSIWYTFNIHWRSRFYFYCFKGKIHFSLTKSFCDLSPPLSLSNSPPPSQHVSHHYYSPIWTSWPCTDLHSRALGVSQVLPTRQVARASDGIWERVRQTVWSLSWRYLVTLYANIAKLTLEHIRWLSNWVGFMSRKILFGENPTKSGQQNLICVPFFSNDIW